MSRFDVVVLKFLEGGQQGVFLFTGVVEEVVRFAHHFAQRPAVFVQRRHDGLAVYLGRFGHDTAYLGDEIAHHLLGAVARSGDDFFGFMFFGLAALVGDGTLDEHPYAE